jgi:hypothetical protein
MGRAWEYWTARLQKAGGLPPQARSRATAKAKRPAKRASKARGKRSRR